MPIELENSDNFNYVSPNNKVDYVIIRSLLHLSELSAVPASSDTDRANKYLNVRDLLVLDLAPLVYPKITHPKVQERYHQLMSALFDKKYAYKVEHPDELLRLLQEFRFILSNTMAAVGMYDAEYGGVEDVQGYIPRRGRPKQNEAMEINDIPED